MKFTNYILDRVKPYKVPMGLSLFGAVLVGISTGAIAYIIKPLLDDLFINKDETMLVFIPIGLVAIYATKGIGRFLQSYYAAFIAGKIINNMRFEIMSHVMFLNFAVFYRLGTGEITSKTVSDVDKIKQFLLAHASSIVKSIITIICMLGVIFYHSPKLALITFVVVPLMIYPLTVFTKKMKKHSKNSQDKISLVISKLNEILNNFEAIKSFRAENIELEKFQTTNKGFFKHYLKAEKTNALIGPIMEVGTSLAVALTIVVGGQEVINGNISAGTFFSFMTALIMLYEPIKRLSMDTSRLHEAAASYERIQDILSKQLTIKNGHEELQTPITTIDFKGVNFGYEDGNELALMDINTTIATNQTIALVGQSGSGKSSFAHLISRFYDTTGGALLINGKSIKSFTKASLRERIALVPQRIFIFNDTVANNITYGHESDTAKIHEAITKAHAEFIYDLPGGIDEVLSEFGTNLSGGQRQRIAIARAIYKNPDVYIFDEATSALDNESQRHIKESIAEISQDKIVILIAHRMSSIEHADRILLFQEGQLITEGTYEELLHNELFKKIANWQG